MQNWRILHFGNYGNLGIWVKGNEILKTAAQYPVLLNIQFYSYLVENSQKATLIFHFKSRFPVKPSKLLIYFSLDCSKEVFIKSNFLLKLAIPSSESKL